MLLVQMTYTSPTYDFLGKYAGKGVFKNKCEEIRFYYIFHKAFLKKTPNGSNNAPERNLTDTWVSHHTGRVTILDTMVKKPIRDF